MSKRHQANRRRTYGRRQHELRERSGHLVEIDARAMADEMPEQRRAASAFGRFDLGLAAPGLAFLSLD